LRRSRRRNTAQRQVLLDTIGGCFGSRVEVSGGGAGAHIVLWPRRRVSEEVLIAEAASLGVGIYGISPYFLNAPARTGVMLGYSRMREAEIREGIRRLAKVF
jgi:GntR family transcriptional regulator/MocR family aminotransferase